MASHARRLAGLKRGAQSGGRDRRSAAADPTGAGAGGTGGVAAGGGSRVEARDGIHADVRLEQEDSGASKNCWRTYTPANGERPKISMDGARILVVRLGAMGDVIHALPAVASLKHSFPRSQSPG